MKVTIDCYGFPNTDSRFKKRKALFYESADAGGGVTYVRFSAAATCVIHRITNTANTARIEWTYGAWADRATLSYPNTLNDVITIDA